MRGILVRISQEPNPARRAILRASAPQSGNTRPPRTRPPRCRAYALPSRSLAWDRSSRADAQRLPHDTRTVLAPPTSTPATVPAGARVLARKTYSGENVSGALHEPTLHPPLPTMYLRVASDTTVPRLVAEGTLACSDLSAPGPNVHSHPLTTTKSSEVVLPVHEPAGATPRMDCHPYIVGAASTEPGSSATSRSRCSPRGRARAQLTPADRLAGVVHVSSRDARRVASETLRDHCHRRCPGG
jgi:hypothetical protein